MNRWLSILFCLAVLSSCQKEEVEHHANSLQGYINESRDFELTQELIACAARIPAVTPGLDSSIAVFFYPLDESYDYNIYLTDSAALDQNDYNNYREVEMDTDLVFNGALRKFPLNDASREQWAIITFKRKDKLHICHPIRLKGRSKPTEFSQSLVITGAGPTFCWSDGLIPENAIYFQVITSASGDLVSGTYTYDKCYTHYELDNVVLNITDPDAETDLTSGYNYGFTLMAVSVDNWVNLVIEKDFIGP